MSKLKDLAVLCNVLNLPTRSGRHSCPFHDSSQEAFAIWQDANGVYRWKCHSGDCGSGTVIEAIAKKRNLSVEAALLALGEPKVQPDRIKQYVLRHHEADPKVWPSLCPYSVRAVSTKLELELDLAAADPSVVLNHSDLAYDEIQGCWNATEFERALLNRGIPLWVAKKFGFACTDIVLGGGLSYTNAWIFPVPTPWGEIGGYKVHFEWVPQGRQKSKWLAIGKNRRHGGPNTFYPWPELYDTDSLPPLIADWPDEWRHRLTELRRQYENEITDSATTADISEKKVRQENCNLCPNSGEEPYYLCPGELKAFAIIGAGLQGVGITGGENQRWPAGMARRLAGRKVVIVYDDDKTGLEWRDKTIRDLRPLCPELRAVTFGHRMVAVVADDETETLEPKKIDANDIARDFGPAGLRAKLDAFVAAAPNLARRQFDMGYNRNDLEAKLTEYIVNARGHENEVLVLANCVGSGKSTYCRRILERNPAIKASIYVPNHALGMEYEDAKRPAAVLRVVSPEKASEGGLITDAAGQMTECPSLQRIKKLTENGLPYAQKVCAACPLKTNCAAWTQKGKMEDAQVLVLQHAHLRLAESKSETYVADRLQIIDESCILGGVIRKVEFDDDKLNRFESIVKGFQLMDRENGQAVGALLRFIEGLRALGAGQSYTPEANAGRWFNTAFDGAWGRFLNNGSDGGYNLMPEVLHSIKCGQWIRRDALNGKELFWTRHGTIPRTKTPIIVFDATVSAPVRK